MNNSELRQIVEEQKAELVLFKESEMVPREKVPDINTDSNLAQIITGIRRFGKSTLAWQVLQQKNFAYVNFDDERFLNIEAEKLN